MINKGESIRDIYGLWYEQPVIYFWIERFIILCLAFIIVLLIYFLYQKYAYKKRFILPKDRALQDLFELQSSVIQTEEDSKKAYFRLSLIIKEYVSSLYHTSFVHLTDKEFIVHASLYMSFDCVDILRKIFQDMTRIKFEHQVGIVEKLRHDIEQSIILIKKTTPVDTTKGS